MPHCEWAYILTKLTYFGNLKNKFFLLCSLFDE